VISFTANTLKFLSKIPQILYSCLPAINGNLSFSDAPF